MFMKIINFNQTNTLFNQFLSEIRNVHVQGDSLRFRRNIERVGEIMAYEISRTLPYHPVSIQTPLATAVENIPAEQPVVATILRAGLPLHQGFLNYFDHAENAFVSAYRKYIDEDNFDIHIEYIASPRLDGKILILTDPMLATGSSMELAYEALLTKGEPAHIHIASVIASRQAIEHIKKYSLQKRLQCGVVPLTRNSTPIRTSYRDWETPAICAMERKNKPAGPSKTCHAMTTDNYLYHP